MTSTHILESFWSVSVFFFVYFSVWGGCQEEADLSVTFQSWVLPRVMKTWQTVNERTKTGRAIQTGQHGHTGGH